MASPALPGLFFCFAAMVLLIFASISVPVWSKVTFLNASWAGAEVDFGCWGYTGSPRQLGYYWPNALPGITNTRLSQTVFHNLTYVLVLHPIGAGLAALAVLFGLCGAAYSRAGTIFMSIASSLAGLVTLVAMIVDLVLFGIAMDEIRNHGGAAQYGIANWFTVAAFASLLLGFCTGSCGIFGRYRERRFAAKV
ncbi:pali-domain-containing protein [Dacryopinax primogenitus]|uniref:Pali-domain-containing protein n=1 Tax=Dacryopinax primogenitus (strain DJM 731) TaxID=1858805 RepID=M5G928_DACPD|nr:pali-domain-containing protein [Dacryopinax primogenitus]EJU05234.1 pali-domain-containing protein [Dacryopinax primogenitus]